MGAKAKITIAVLFLIILGVALWQLTSPPALPPIGTKYSTSGTYSTQENWIIREDFSHGTVFLAISAANLTFPKIGIETDYSFVISNINQTITSSYIKGIGAKTIALTIQDNYDGSTSRWNTGSLTDAVQIISLFYFKTTASHQLRITITFQLYDLPILGSTPDKTITTSFNITQTVL